MSRDSGELRRVTVYTDGAARGNPGPAGAGAHIEDEHGTEVAQVFEYLGETTNNVAEYRALLLGLARAQELGVSEVEVRADSELMIRQMTGRYRVRNPGLIDLHRQAQVLEKSFRRVRYVHIPRERNRLADRLANRAIDVDSGRAAAQKGPKT